MMEREQLRTVSTVEAVSTALEEDIYALRDLYRIDETHPVVVNEVRIVRYAVRKRPQALEERLVAVIDAHIINLVLNFFCHCAYLLRYADICLPKAGDT